MTYLEHCHYREVDGVCIACINFLDPEVTQLVNSDMSIVTIDHVFDSHICIQSNNKDGIRQLVEYIHSKNHRKIAYVHGPKSAVTDTRLGSFYRTMERLQAPVPEEYMLECEYNEPKSAYRATLRLLDLPNRPTCIMISDDYAALGAYDAIKDRGLEVGKDISVAGYDGIPLMQLLKPHLTTVRQDTNSIGAEAARKLVELIENPKTAIPEIAITPCTLIKGETVCTLDK